jgi:hypothetical protein
VHVKDILIVWPPIWVHVKYVLTGSWTTLGTMALTMGILFKTRHELLGSQEGPDALGLKKLLICMLMKTLMETPAITGTTTL